MIVNNPFSSSQKIPLHALVPTDPRPTKVYKKEEEKKDHNPRRRSSATVLENNNILDMKENRMET